MSNDLELSEQAAKVIWDRLKMKERTLKALYEGVGDPLIAHQYANIEGAVHELKFLLNESGWSVKGFI